MAVEVAPLNILGVPNPPITRFTSSLAVAPGTARNIISPPSDDWIYIPTGGDTPTAGAALGTYNLGTALVGGGFGLGMSRSSYAFTTYSFATALCPAVLYLTNPSFYNAKQKFIQITFDSVSLLAASMGFMNYIDASGTGVAGTGAICHDAYTCRIDTRSQIDRWNSGATVTNLHASSGAPVLNDVYRFSIDQTTPGQVTVRYTLNGVFQFSVVDNAAGFVSGPLFPIIGSFQFAGAGSTLTCKNFDCGIGL
jgi:hypothetical protein